MNYSDSKLQLNILIQTVVTTEPGSSPYIISTTKSHRSIFIRSEIKSRLTYSPNCWETQALFLLSAKNVGIIAKFWLQIPRYFSRWPLKYFRAKIYMLWIKDFNLRHMRCSSKHIQQKRQLFVPYLHHQII